MLITLFSFIASLLSPYLIDIYLFHFLSISLLMPMLFMLMLALMLSYATPIRFDAAAFRHFLRRHIRLYGFFSLC